MTSHFLSSEALCSIRHTKQGKQSLLCLLHIFSSLNVTFPPCSVFVVVFFSTMHPTMPLKWVWAGKRRSFQLKWRLEFQRLHRAGHCNCYETVPETKSLLIFCFCSNLRVTEKLWHLPIFLRKDLRDKGGKESSRFLLAPNWNNALSTEGGYVKGRQSLLSGCLQSCQWKI